MNWYLKLKYYLFDDTAYLYKKLYETELERVIVLEESIKVERKKHQAYVEKMITELTVVLDLEECETI